ncbi:ester cyclase [Desulfospira joergensenii]|uniref:ester cyclase n=1 Tax=Desulfospira joergensenii TaxID=53329 RepID=UPI0003B39F50|nr:ester cyclase [Desulfospira joergensenii]
MQPKDLVSILIDEAFNKGNLSVIEKVIHPEYEYWSPHSQLKGIGQLTEFIRAFRDAFPDLSLKINDFFSSDDRTCTAFTLKGTHEQDFMGIPATKKSVEIHGMVISRIKDNKIVEDRELLDNLTFFQQLGIVPDIS